jgi:hypothetical protein
MQARLTIIDNFHIDETLRERGSSLPLGVFYVLDGTFAGAHELPEVGSFVRITTPSGRVERARVKCAEVRPHGAAALVFEEEFVPRLPQLSVVSEAH